MTQTFYRILVKGHLDQLHWSNWLAGLTVTHLENGETLLAGYLVDQSALYGVLHKLESQHVTLLAVNRVSPDETPPTSEGEEGIR